jgi:hypothetical protein
MNKQKISIDSLVGSMSLEDMVDVLDDMDKPPRKQNPHQSLEALYEWVRADMSVEMASAGIIESPTLGKRIVEVYMDEYEYETPHFNLEIMQRNSTPLPVAKITIPEMDFLKNLESELEVLWTHKDYPLSKKELKVVASWLRKLSKSDKETYNGLTNLQIVRILWDAQNVAQSFGQVSHRSKK